MAFSVYKGKHCGKISWIKKAYRLICNAGLLDFCYLWISTDPV